MHKAQSTHPRLLPAPGPLVGSWAREVCLLEQLLAVIWTHCFGLVWWFFVPFADGCLVSILAWCSFYVELGVGTMAKKALNMSYEMYPYVVKAFFTSNGIWVRRCISTERLVCNKADLGVVLVKYQLCHRAFSHLSSTIGNQEAHTVFSHVSHSSILPQRTKKNPKLQTMTSTPKSPNPPSLQQNTMNFNAAL